MRFKTSFFIDESIDIALDTRSKKKGKPKSQIMQSDLETLYLCLDIGIEECACSLTKQQIDALQVACSELTDEKSKTNFILSGYLRNSVSHDIRDAAKRISKLSRLSILDMSEGLKI